MFTSKEFNKFRADVEQALIKVAESHNVDIKTGHISYTENEFKLTLNVNKKEINGKSFEQAEFEKYCKLYGFAPEDYLKEFTMSGRSFALYGFNAKAKTMPVLARDTEGKEYKFHAQDVKALLKTK